MLKCSGGKRTREKWFKKIVRRHTLRHIVVTILYYYIGKNKCRLIDVCRSYLTLSFFSFHSFDMGKSALRGYILCWSRFSSTNKLRHVLRFTTDFTFLFLHRETFNDEYDHHCFRFISSFKRTRWFELVYVPVNIVLFLTIWTCYWLLYVLSVENVFILKYEIQSKLQLF